MKNRRNRVVWSPFRFAAVACLVMGALLPGCERHDGRGQATVPGGDAVPGPEIINVKSGVTGFAPQSVNDPHVPTDPGPWFEGWYFRVSDIGGSRSMAVIVASHLPRNETYTPGTYLPGYVNVLISEGDGAPTVSYTAFPEETMARVNGEPVRSNPDLIAASDFEWIAEGFGRVTEDSVDMRIPGLVEISIRTTNRKPWDAGNPHMGPEGLLVFLPFPLHWYIHSMGSDAEYTYTIIEEGFEEHVSGTGYAHLEKNWQREFPVGWVWSQGIAEDNKAQFVVSTATIALDDTATFVPWILGYRSERLSWDYRFSIPGSTLTTEMDACAGTLHMEARDLFRTLIVDAAAPPDSFGSVSIPTQEGFVAETGGESFSATVVVSASWHLPIPGCPDIEYPIEQQVFYNAALEFGNGYGCQEE